MERKHLRKQQKRKAREKSIRKQKHDAFVAKKQRERRAAYPAFRLVIHGGNGIPAFTQACVDAANSLDFEDTKAFNRLERTYYRNLREYGFAQTERAFKETLANLPDSKAEQVELSIQLNLGEQIFQRIPEKVRRDSIPYATCDVVPKQNWLELRMDFLESEPGSAGRRHFSRHRPTVEIDGTDYVVAFSRHAIDQLCSRLKPERISYGACGDLFAWFGNNVFFRPVSLHNDQPAIEIFDFCIYPGIAQYEFYVKRVLGEDSLDWDGGLPYYRIGYCPVVLEDGFAKAKTLLCPGFTATPEYGLLLKAGLPREQRERFQALATQTAASVTAISNGTAEHLKWFHENGVPQVLQFDHEVFRSESSKRITMISQFPPLLNRKRNLGI